MKFALSHTNASIEATTRFSHTDMWWLVFNEISDLSATKLYWRDNKGDSITIEVPTSDFNVVINRNSKKFAQVIFTKIKNINISLDEIEAMFDPILLGPIKCIDNLNKLVWWDYKSIQFELFYYIWWWWRYFWNVWYIALENLLRNSEPKNQNDDFLDNLGDKMNSEMMIQRFIELDSGNCLRLMFDIDDKESKNSLKVFNKIRKNLEKIKNNPEKLKIVSFILSRSYSNHIIKSNDINLSFLEHTSNLWWESIIKVISQSNSIDELQEEIADEIIITSLKRKISENEFKILRWILHSIYAGAENIFIDFQECDILEKSNIYLWLYDVIIKEKIPKEISFIVIKEYLDSYILPNFDLLAVYINDIWVDKNIKKLIKRISPNEIIVLFDKIESTENKKKFLSICDSQMILISSEIRDWNILPYVRLIHFFGSWKKEDPVSMFFGITSLISWSMKSINNPNIPLLSYETKKTYWIISRAKNAIRLLQTPSENLSKDIMGSIKNWVTLKNSLLYDFDKDFFPIGWKLHFTESLSKEKVALIHDICWFGMTPFKLLHADTSLCLPPCQSPAQLIAILYKLIEIWIIEDDSLELQLSIPWRVPNELAWIVGSACIFLKNKWIEYPKNSFVTSHNNETATCIMCYDAWELDKKWFPNIQGNITWRTDMLGFKRIEEVISYFLVWNFVSQMFYWWNLCDIWKEFTSEFKLILERFNLGSILDSKWVHIPWEKWNLEEENRHYETIKMCTDMLWKDISDYIGIDDLSGISFAVKKLLYQYIIKYNLLPLDSEWVRRYLSALVY